MNFCNELVILVLEVVQPFGQRANVVIVDKGDRANGLFFFVPGLQHQMVADEIAHRLGTSLVAAIAQRLIELREQLLVKRYGETDGLAHARQHPI